MTHSAASNVLTSRYDSLVVLCGMSVCSHTYWLVQVPNLEKILPNSSTQDDQDDSSFINSASVDSEQPSAGVHLAVVKEQILPPPKAAATTAKKKKKVRVCGVRSVETDLYRPK